LRFTARTGGASLVASYTWGRFLNRFGWLPVLIVHSLLFFLAASLLLEVLFSPFVAGDISADSAHRRIVLLYVITGLYGALFVGFQVLNNTAIITLFKENPAASASAFASYRFLQAIIAAGSFVIRLLFGAVTVTILSVLVHIAALVCLGYLFRVVLPRGPQYARVETEDRREDEELELERRS
jgi:hypothetical protein